MPAHTLVDTAPGTIIDVQPDRILFYTEPSGTRVPAIKHRDTGTIETISDVPPDFAIKMGFLSPHGAIFAGTAPAAGARLYEWRDGAIIDLGPLELTDNCEYRCGLVVNGDYAIWQNIRTLLRRNLATGTTITVDTNTARVWDTGAAPFGDVAPNGDVVYSSFVDPFDPNARRQIRRYRNGTIQQLTNNTENSDAPLTDGTNVAYRHRGVSVYYDGSGQVVLTGSVVQFHEIAGGWVAFQRSVDVREVWRRSSLGTEERASLAGQSGEVAAVNGAGDVMYNAYNHLDPNDNGIYLASPGFPPVNTGICCSLAGRRGLAGSYAGYLFSQDGNWYRTYKTDLYRLDRDAVDLSVVQTDSPDPVDVGQSVTYTATVTNDGPGTANRVHMQPRFIASAFTIEEATGPRGPCPPVYIGISDRHVFSCDIGTLDPGENATVTIRLTARKGGTFTYTTPVTSLEHELQPVDNTYVSTTTIRSYVRPKGATPILASLVVSHLPCPNTVVTAPNRGHQGPLGYDSCNPPVQTSPYLTAGTPDANGAAANLIGSMRLDVCPVSGCAAPNVRLQTQLSDVRCKPAATPCGAANATSGADYAGELESFLRVRLTDKYIDPNPSILEPNTTVDFDFPFTTQCTPTTTDTSKGSDCAIVTTVNSVVPGALASGKQAIMQLNQVRVLDGGSDGDAETTADNSRFAVQGFLLP